MTAETDRQVVKRVAEIAEKHGVPRAHIALAWLLQKEPVTAPIIGATKISHLEDAVGALSVKLTPEEVAYLEEPYVPHRIVGISNANNGKPQGLKRSAGRRHSVDTEINRFRRLSSLCFCFDVLANFSFYFPSLDICCSLSGGLPTHFIEH